MAAAKMATKMRAGCGLASWQLLAALLLGGCLPRPDAGASLTVTVDVRPLRAKQQVVVELRRAEARALGSKTQAVDAQGGAEVRFDRLPPGPVNVHVRLVEGGANTSLGPFTLADGDEKRVPVVLSGR